MFKKLSLTAPFLFFLMAWASTALAQIDTLTCNKLTQELQDTQAKIDHSRDAYERSAKVIDERLAHVNAAAQKGDDLGDLWPGIVAARDEAIPLAKEALRLLNSGFALMQDYVKAGCTTLSADNVENRRKQGASRYENGLQMLAQISDDWHDNFAKTDSAADPATCAAIDKSYQDADAKAKAHSLKYDSSIAAYRKARLAVNQAIDLERPFTTEWETLIKTYKAALPGTKAYGDLIRAIFTPTRLGLSEGCIIMNDAQIDAFEKNAKDVLADIDDSYQRMVDMPLDAKTYVQVRRKTTTARVGIINDTDQILCIHPNGTGKGKCVIKPHGTRVVELGADDTDESGTVLLITNRTNALKDAEGNKQPQSLTVCAKQVFEHKSGSKAWTIKTGVAKGCSLPATTD